MPNRNAIQNVCNRKERRGFYRPELVESGCGCRDITEAQRDTVADFAIALPLFALAANS